MNKNRVAIYCRLSKDDEQIGDSVSISTQKMLLSGYCQNQGFEIIDIYIDDGFSGLNFNRPSFKRMVNDIEDGKIDIVVTKDLSRLGRDYIQTGYYIDVYFSTKHIRYTFTVARLYTSWCSIALLKSSSNEIHGKYGKRISLFFNSSKAFCLNITS